MPRCNAEKSRSLLLHEFVIEKPRWGPDLRILSLNTARQKPSKASLKAAEDSRESERVWLDCVSGEGGKKRVFTLFCLLRPSNNLAKASGNSL